MTNLVHIDIVSDGACAVVRVLRDVDVNNASDLGAALTDLIERRRYDRVIVDWSSVEHMDSSGLGALVAAWREARRTNVGFFLAGVNDGLQRVLELTRLSDVFEITPTVRDALRKSGGQTQPRHSSPRKVIAQCSVGRRRFNGPR